MVNKISILCYFILLKTNNEKQNTYLFSILKNNKIHKQPIL